jgi:hypothetical protein
MRGVGRFGANMPSEPLQYLVTPVIRLREVRKYSCRRGPLRIRMMCTANAPSKGASKQLASNWLRILTGGTWLRIAT